MSKSSKTSVSVDAYLGAHVNGWVPFHPEVARAFAPYVPVQRSYLMIMCALFLGVCWKWAGKSTRHARGVFDKSDRDFRAEIGVSDRQFREVCDLVCRRLGLVKRTTGGRRNTSHYRIDEAQLSAWWLMSGPAPALQLAESGEFSSSTGEQASSSTGEQASSSTGEQASSCIGGRTSKETTQTLALKTPPNTVGVTSETNQLVGGGDLPKEVLSDTEEEIMRAMEECGVRRNGRTLGLVRRLAVTAEMERLLAVVRGEHSRLMRAYEAGTVRDVPAALIGALEQLSPAVLARREPAVALARRTGKFIRRQCSYTDAERERKEREAARLLELEEQEQQNGGNHEHRATDERGDAYRGDRGAIRGGVRGEADAARA